MLHFIMRGKKEVETKKDGNMFEWMYKKFKKFHNFQYLLEIKQLWCKI